ncbi:hypothetical protein EV682_101583 [Iodobacter fluviatilis]|uniref:Uncharacterized protein n=1 Tax=Iodobacter fluviatilis TaxID=537 RepID=A0A377Q2T0_9NEIS|nr:hypothetical protein EV682_101583 [Iodobacter fluviatilis]STQ89576.1 Uncharacterised protein [Iodobacter fluviatilis]
MPCLQKNNASIAFLTKKPHTVIQIFAALHRIKKLFYDFVNTRVYQEID